MDALVLLYGPNEPQLTTLQDCDARRERLDLLDVLGREDDGPAVLANRLHGRPQPPSLTGVERRCRSGTVSG